MSFHSYFSLTIIRHFLESLNAAKQVLYPSVDVVLWHLKSNITFFRSISKLKEITVLEKGSLAESLTTLCQVQVTDFGFGIIFKKLLAEKSWLFCG